MKYLSIITNFEGAHVGVPFTALSSLDMLKDAVRFEKAEAVSVRGGGDPLFEYDKHKKYYERLFRICRGLKIPVEMQTKYVENEFPYERCSYVVYLVSDYDQLAKIVRHGEERIRVIFTVDKSCTLDLIDNVANYCDAAVIINSLYFKVDGDKASHIAKSCREYLRKGHGIRWGFVERFEDDPPYFINGEIRYHWSDISG